MTDGLPNELPPFPRCPWAGGSPPKAAKTKGFYCHNCEGQGDHYWVHDDVWLAAWPAYAAAKKELRRCLVLCFGCLEKRLGRLLVAEDFDHSRPINRPIILGLRMARLERCFRRDLRGR